MLAMGLTYMAFIMLMHFSSLSTLFRDFIMRGWRILSNTFSAFIEKIKPFSFFILLIWDIILIDFHVLNHPCIPGTNLTWYWYMILFIYCWIRFASILLRIFTPILIRATSYCASICLFCQGNAGLINAFGSVPSSSTFWKHLRKTGVNSSLNVW